MITLLKKFLFVALVMIFFAATASAESKPVRIARLPIIFQNTIPDADTCAKLETKIARAVHVPLNGTLQLVEYLPPKDSAEILNNLWQEMRRKNKKVRLQDTMRPLAQKLDADIIVCPILKKYIQHDLGLSGWEEAKISSHVIAELIVYDRRTDELIDKKSAEMYNDSYMPHGTASFLANICFNRVIDDTKIRQRIIAIRK